ncbi:MAG: damage-control phosphatase ARMT1 family protein [Thermoproteota archaeon]
MKPDLLCIPCTLNAAYDISSKATADEDEIRKILFQTLEWLRGAIEGETPPNVLHTEVYRMVRRLTGVRDPFKNLKAISNDAALRVYPSVMRMVESIEDRVEEVRFCLKASIIGNMMDFEVHGHRFSLEELESRFEDYLREPLAIDNVNELCEIIGKGVNVLYLTDNSGEIVFDKLVAMCLKSRWGCNVTMVVKGGPVLNDATLEDARQVKLAEACDKVIETGDDTIGIVMDRVSGEFKQALKNADLIISKGQGNFESLAGFEMILGKPICYVLRVKCEVIGKHLDVPKGSNVVKLVYYV